MRFWGIARRGWTRGFLSDRVVCVLYEHATPAAEETPCAPPSPEATATPFARKRVEISQEEYIQLKWDARYWRGQHQRGLLREAEQKTQIEELLAQVRDLRQRLFGRRSEKGAAVSEAQGKSAARRARGQQPGSAGHGRVDLSHLPVREEEVADVPSAQQGCPTCHQPLVRFEGTEDSEIIEIEVQAYRRRIRRQRYQRSCDCPTLPGIVTAPAAPRLIAKGRLGISVWVQIVLSKYLYAQPTHRLLQSWANFGLHVAQGTIIGGLKQMAPLFAPVVAAIQEQQLTEGYYHVDETTWKVFEPIEGKVGYRWYLWVIVSHLSIVYVPSPSRAAAVPLEYFAHLLVESVLVCDRYGAYKKFARIMGVLLAFCWAHVRRDQLELARSYPQCADFAMGWVARIGTLYHLNERRLAVQAQPGMFAERDLQLRAHLHQMVTDRNTALADPTLHAAARKVLKSLQNHWEGLTVFVERPEIAMDNNCAEETLRNEVLGRKAYYGSGSVWAAQLAGMLFTILKTLVRCWQINPQVWLQEYFQACAANGRQAPQDLSAFLPWRMSPQRLQYLRGPALLPANTS